jgi:hypothetical protein
MVIIPPNINKKSGSHLGKFAILNDSLRAQPQPAK